MVTGTGSSPINLIIDAQRAVALAENGTMGFPILLDHLIAVDRAEGEFGADPYEFVGTVYHDFRIIEAVLHWQQGKNLEGEFAVRLMIIARNAQILRSRIEEQLEINSSYAPDNELERFGQFAIEEKLRWALRLLDESFPAWGY